MCSTVRLELLAPAKNYEYAVAAIDAGADALYIGAPNFGARYGATNSVDDIAKVVSYAHLFGVKVYVTFNTLLFDNELKMAKKMAEEVVGTGCDALIVQDMAYRMMGLDIPLHISTQAAANTPSKVAFMEGAGFHRVILERFMSLEDIAAVRKESNVDLEAFVHGAICVGESGKCYMGQAISGRSGNRGVCSQLCRDTYTLRDEKGEVWLKNKHLLSLHDLNLSSYIADLVSVGITSFKIEGRLKDLCYLKNSVAHYRALIDRFIAGNEGYSRSSVGDSFFGFTPAPEKSFSRRFTNYFIGGNKVTKMASFNTAKALGSFVGEVTNVKDGLVTIISNVDFVGGDGICYINPNGGFGGSNVNSAKRDGDRVVLTIENSGGLSRGAKMYRNFDKKFTESVVNDKTTRKVDVDIEVFFDNDRVVLTATDITGCSSAVEVTEVKEAARDTLKMQNTLISQLGKSGDTIFRVTDIEIKGEIKFLSISEINSVRRELLSLLREKRLKEYVREDSRGVAFPAPYTNELGGGDNVVNALARNFYEKCGFAIAEEGYDKIGVKRGATLIHSRYCVRREIGECLKEGGRRGELSIESKEGRFELSFDCKRCMMSVKQK